MSADAASPVSLAFLLALTEADKPMFLYFIIAGLMALGPVIHYYIKIYEWFKGKSTDVTNFVTKAELASAILSVKSDFGRIEQTLLEINRDLPAIHRALGRLEGHDEATSERITTHRRGR
ncbi:MAG: hypothetical protein V4662_13620 [Verrucomicrobiota bacterium]